MPLISSIPMLQYIDDHNICNSLIIYYSHYYTVTPNLPIDIYGCIAMCSFSHNTRIHKHDPTQ